MAQLRDLRILYEDGDCIAVEKIQGLSSEEASGASMPSLLRAYRTEKGERDEIFPVHRLDLPTGGAILYAKTGEAAAVLSASVMNREIGKCYLTVVCGAPSTEAGQLEDLLYHDKRQNKVFTVKSERKGAKKAILEYRVAETVEHEGQILSLVEINLVTGRTHQIRAQFASRKWPVYGDRRYGARASLPGGAIALWSHALSFRTPSGAGQTLMSFPTDAFPWNLFASLSRAREAHQSENTDRSSVSYTVRKEAPKCSIQHLTRSCGRQTVKNIPRAGRPISKRPCAISTKTAVP